MQFRWGSKSAAVCSRYVLNPSTMTCLMCMATRDGATRERAADPRCAHRQQPGRLFSFLLRRGRATREEGPRVTAVWHAFRRRRTRACVAPVTRAVRTAAPARGGSLSFKPRLADFEISKKLQPARPVRPRRGLAGHSGTLSDTKAGAMAAPRPPKLLSLLLQLLLLSRATRGDDTPLFPAWLERLYPGLGDSVQLTCEGSFDASLHADVLSRCVRITGSLTVTGLIPDTLSTREPYNRVLRTVDGDVLIERNRVLTSLRGAFPGLVSVGGDVRVVDTGLVYLTGFESLSTVDGTVLVVDNARMLGFGDGVVTAFSSLLSVGGESIFMFVRAISMTSCVFCQQARW